MPFRFKKTESPAKGVRRLCRERIGEALGRLRESDRPAVVHGVRKEVKKLRAILRLVRGEIGKGAYRKGSKALREAARCLAATRDARVKLKAFEKLTGRSARRFAGIEKALRKNCLREKRRFQKKNSIAVANRILRKTDRRVGNLKIKSVGWPAIEPGLMQSYSRGREIYELVRAKPSPENFHDWRKHVKNLWYYFRMLCPAWLREMRVMKDELESLGEQLGDAHDLVLLKQFSTKRCAGQAGEVKALGKLIESRQKKLRAAALKLGSRLYADEPRVICKRLGNCWSVWRGENSNFRI